MAWCNKKCHIVETCSNIGNLWQGCAAAACGGGRQRHVQESSALDMSSNCTQPLHSTPSSVAAATSSVGPLGTAAPAVVLHSGAQAPTAASAMPHPSSLGCRRGTHSLHHILQ